MIARIVLMLGLLTPLSASAQLMQMGIGSGSATGAAPIAACSGTGLDFTVDCNSQYIGLLQ